MAAFTVENSVEGAAVEKIQTFTKHINVNCQYNYNVSGLINDPMETPTKDPSESFSSVLDQSHEERVCYCFYIFLEGTILSSSGFGD